MQARIPLLEQNASPRTREGPIWQRREAGHENAAGSGFNLLPAAPVL